MRLAPNPKLTASLKTQRNAFALKRGAQAFVTTVIYPFRKCGGLCGFLCGKGVKAVLPPDFVAQHLDEAKNWGYDVPEDGGWCQKLSDCIDAITMGLTLSKKASCAFPRKCFLPIEACVTAKAMKGGGIESAVAAKLKCAAIGGEQGHVVAGVAISDPPPPNSHTDTMCATCLCTLGPFNLGGSGARREGDWRAR